MVERENSWSSAEVVLPRPPITEGERRRESAVAMARSLITLRVLKKAWEENQLMEQFRAYCEGYGLDPKDILGEAESAGVREGEVRQAQLQEA